MLLLSKAGIFASLICNLVAASGPMVAVINGSYEGVSLPTYNQDAFLGVPYAKPPIDDLRFVAPQPLDAAWYASKPATTYSHGCYGYGNDSYYYEPSEDCLYLNVVRPSNCGAEPLPVAVWIHGGGYYQGSSVLPKYNLSFIVQESVNLGKPMLAVSLNYRLSVWGFIGGEQIADEGNTNLGLRDQRLALHWIQENIAAFGGDPTKVTIWGESVGANAVGFHMTAFNGRDDHLFRAGIMQSGAPIYFTDLLDTKSYQPRLDALATAVNCANTQDVLGCLRHVPADQLNGVISQDVTLVQSWPYVDGDFIVRWTSQQLQDGSFVKVPIIIGCNTDEGTAFSPIHIKNDRDFMQSIKTDVFFGFSMTDDFANQLAIAYPNDPSQGIPADLAPAYVPGPPYGKQYRRAAAYYGDALFIANKRLTCETWAQNGIPAYCYRFNAVPAGIPAIVGATHEQEMAFIFDNTLGIGYTPFYLPPFEGMPDSYFRMATAMSDSWISFVVDLDPNTWKGSDAPAEGNGGMVSHWPTYNELPLNFLFEPGCTYCVENDTFRAEGISLINKAVGDVYWR